MAQKLLNIEIGEKFVKVCVSQGTPKNYKVVKGFQFEYVGDIVSDGQVTNVEELGNQIQNALIENGLANENKATFIFSSTKVPVREVTLPPVKQDKLGDLVKLNASEYFPVDVANYHITHAVLEKISKPEPGYKVLVTAVPLSILKSYFELGRKLGLAIEAIDYAPNSQMQILSSLEQSGVTMYLSINLNSTTATFLQDGKFLLQRNMPMGGDEIISAALRQNDLEVTDYVTTLEKCKDDNWLPTALPKEIYDAAMNRLTSGIGRTVEFFRSNQKGMGIDNVVIFGSAAKIYGLKENLQDKLGIPCQILTTIPKHEKAVMALDTNVVNYISCLGSLIAPLDLIPDEFNKKNQKSKEQAESLTGSILICALGIIAGVLLAGSATIENMAKNAEIADINKQIDELQYVVDTYNLYTEYAEMDHNLNVFVADAENKNEGLVNFLDELEKRIPENIVVMNAACDNNGVTINATVESFDEVAVALANIRSMESIEVINISGATEQVSESGAASVTFSVTAIYTVPVEEPVALPQPIFQDTEPAA